MQKEAEGIRARYRQACGKTTRIVEDASHHLMAAAEAMANRQLNVALEHVQKALTLEPHNPEVRAIHGRLSAIATGSSR